MHKQIVSIEDASSKKLALTSFFLTPFFFTPFLPWPNFGSFLQCGHSHVLDTLCKQRQARWNLEMGQSGFEHVAVGSSQVFCSNSCRRLGLDQALPSNPSFLCTTSQAFLAIYKFSKTMKALPPGMPYVPNREKFSLELTLNCCSRLQKQQNHSKPFWLCAAAVGFDNNRHDLSSRKTFDHLIEGRLISSDNSS